MSESHDPSREVADVIFNDSLNEFAARVANICALEAGDKIAPQEAYNRIKRHWKQLRKCKRNLLDWPPDDDAGVTEPGVD